MDVEIFGGLCLLSCNNYQFNWVVSVSRNVGSIVEFKDLKNSSLGACKCWLDSFRISSIYCFLVLLTTLQLVKLLLYLRLFGQVKLQKHNTNVQGITYRNGFHCTARILATEGVCSLILVLFFPLSRTLLVNLLFGSV